MRSITVKQPKIFMSKLLTGDAFDKFLLETAEIETYNTFTIDGRTHKDFYKGSAEKEEIQLKEFSEWEKIRPICLELIKGKHTPLKLKFVLRLSDDKKEEVFKDLLNTLSPDQFTPCININFALGEISVITGISYNIFTLEKDIEKAWDAYIPSFLESLGIEITET